MGWWVSDLLRDDPALLISQIVWVIGSIVLHELAHGWAAIRCGDRTPIELGHMTWNPLVHMGKMSLIMFAVVGIAWGMMPVNPSRLRHPNDRALVAAAGPMTNALLALTSMILGGAWLAYGSTGAGPLHANISTFFLAGAYLNILLMLFNLIPVPPLDGSTILSTLSPTVRRLYAHPRGQAVAMGLLLLVFFYGGKAISAPAATLAIKGMRGVAAFLGHSP